MIARGDLDEEREIAPGGNWQPDVRLRNAEELVGFASDAQPVVFGSLGPFFEFDHEIDRLDITRGGDAEEIFDVDDADSAQLHVMAQQIVRVSEEDVVGMTLDDDHVIGDEAMAAIHEIERAFALADAAVTEKQNADAVDVEKTGVHGDL